MRVTVDYLGARFLEKLALAPRELRSTLWPQSIPRGSGRLTVEQDSFPQLEGQLVNLYVALAAQVPRIADRLRIVEGDVSKHGDLSVCEA